MLLVPYSYTNDITDAMEQHFDTILRDLNFYQGVEFANFVDKCFVTDSDSPNLR